MGRLTLLAVAMWVCVLSGVAQAQSPDFPPTAATTCVITPGGAVSSTIEAPSDVDWCRFTLEEGRNHAFLLQVSGQPGQTLTLPSGIISIYDADGNLLAPRSGPSSLQTNYIAPANGTAYIQIAASNTVFDQGTYRLVMRSRDDAGSNPNSSAVPVAGSTVSGSIEGISDIDWYRVELLAGRQYGFEVFDAGDNPALTLPSGRGYAEVRNANGTLLINRNSSYSFTATTTQTAYVAVTADSIGDINIGTYQLVLRNTDAVGGTGATAGTTAPRRTLTGDIEAESDVDAFNFTARSGERYRVVIQGAGVDQFTNEHVCIEAIRPSGQSLSFQCSGGASTAALEFTTDAAGSWTLAAFARFFETGTYRILISGLDDYGQNLTTIGRVDPGFFANGTAEAPGDEDWFKTALVAGQAATVRVRQAQTGVGSLGNSRLYVLGPNGQELASDIGGGNEPSVTFTPTETGDHVIRVQGFCLLTGVMCFIGTYRVEVAQGAAQPTATTLAAATLPQARSVRIGDPASFFGTILNTGAATATRCGVQPTTTTPARFTFTRTNAANQVVGEPNTRFDIPAGQAGSFVLSFDPSEAYAGQALAFAFDCANTDPAPVFAAVNGFTLSAANDPVPDVIMVAATPTNDGVANIPGANGTGFFSTAAVNIGAAAAIEFRPQAASGTNLIPFVCETSPMTGQCLAPLAASVVRTLATGETAFFSVFFGGGGQTLPFDPANRRIAFLARDPMAPNTLRGSTSVAVRTQ